MWFSREYVFVEFYVIARHYFLPKADQELAWIRRDRILILGGRWEVPGRDLDDQQGAPPPFHVQQTLPRALGGYLFMQS